MKVDLSEIMAEIASAASAIRVQADKIGAFSNQFRDDSPMLYVDLQGIEACLYSIADSLAKLNDDRRNQKSGD